ncbi:flagellar hook-associated protein FlgL [Actinomarinicola tropica]|uniref:Flagellar hook-associated protein 3 n=1 Tax=Actinomarinicola tropica TaxID=2789776 RepID=A0A5Q2RG02_9ACTN|nr:flagellar hook-associated protein FlgL [Actinomarinicola tropica]QGG94633.1 flagellar hook-associated protein 3 [Actinomarinicola tropica]
MNRVTNTSASRTMLASIHRNARQLNDSQERIATGKQVRRPSDGPAQVLSALDYRAQLRRNEQMKRNSLDARAWLDNADSSLTHAVDRLTRARTLVVGAINGSADAQSRAAYAAEIRAIREELVQTANTQYLGRPIFAGTSDATSAYAADGTYLGNEGQVQRNVAPDVSIRVNRTGPEVFGTAADPDGNVFQVLEQIAAALDAGDTGAASAGLEAIGRAADRIERAQVEMGARSKQVEEIGFRNAEVDVELKASLSEVEDVDIAETLIEVRIQEMAYNAALSVTAKVIQPTLLDFLR